MHLLQTQKCVWGTGGILQTNDQRRSLWPPTEEGGAHSTKRRSEEAIDVETREEIAVSRIRLLNLGGSCNPAAWDLSLRWGVVSAGPNSEWGDAELSTALSGAKKIHLQRRSRGRVEVLVGLERRVRVLETMGISKFTGVVLLVALIVVGSEVAAEQVGFGADSGRVVRRLQEDRARAGVSWVVQLSDLHISVWNPERVQALRKLMGTILGSIQPSLVLITGDLTDAKGKAGGETQQYEEEWLAYRDAIDLMIEESGLSLDQFYDIRGNHDKYGVPQVESFLDFYSRYSCNARANRTNVVQSVTLMGYDGWKHLFVGVDDSMSVGLRGPSNLFGHPSDNIIAQLDSHLSQWDGDNSTPVTKIVYGHFPTSFTASSESGHRSEQIMTKHNISAYVCGHLHSKFGWKLYKYHMEGRKGEFWEWEMGDWRVSRMMRVLAIDHDRVSFVDVDLRKISKSVLNGKQFVMPTLILPTSPLDSRFMLRSSSSAPGPTDVGTIRTLIFSKAPPASVTARVFDSASTSLSNFVDHNVIESLEMERVYGHSKEGQGGAFLYEASWDSQKYVDPSPTRYWLQIKVMDFEGNTTTSDSWPISVEGKMGPYHLSFLGFIVMGFNWESIYPVVLWLAIFGILGCLLILPKLALLYLKWRGVYEDWALSIFHPEPNSSFPFLKLPVWALLEGARHNLLWWAQVAYIGLLILFPWFWGRVLADDYPVGYMTLSGWTVWPSKHTIAQQSGVGWPDILGIVLPYIACVVFPTVMMISALCAEQAACELTASVMKAEVQAPNGELGSRDKDVQQPLLLKRKDPASHLTDKPAKLASHKEEEHNDDSIESRFFNRGVRKAYFVGCLAIALLHLKLCLFVASSYGAPAVFLSPIYVWVAPILLVVSVCSTSPIRPRI